MELLVVISIIGILSSLSAVSVNVARVRARDAKRQADIAQVNLALYLYYDDNLEFPDTGDLYLLPEDTNAENWLQVLTPALGGQNPKNKLYMARVPLDPLNNEPYHTYKYVSNGEEFILSYYLETDGPKEIYVHGY